MARGTRRFWSEDEKRRIVAQTCAPGVSVSQVGRRYDVNANLIFKWRRDPRYRPTEDDEGLSTSWIVSAICEINASWICIRFTKASTRRAIFEMPTTRSAGRYPTCAFPRIGTMWFSQWDSRRTSCKTIISS